MLAASNRLGNLYAATVRGPLARRKARAALFGQSSESVHQHAHEHSVVMTDRCLRPTRVGGMRPLL